MLAVMGQWRRHRMSDILLGLLASGVLMWRTDVTKIEPGTLYQVAGGAGIGLLAFVITPVGVLLTLQGGVRYAAFDKAQRPTIIKAMAHAFVLGLVLFVAAILGAAIDNSTTPVEWTRLLAFGATVAACLATGRLFWFFIAGLKVRNKDDDSPIIDATRVAATVTTPEPARNQGP